MNALTAIKAWLGDHKKIVAGIVGALVALVPDSVLDADRRKWIVEVVMVFIAGQGIADHGKEAAKVQVAAGLAPAAAPASSLGAVPVAQSPQ